MTANLVLTVSTGKKEPCFTQQGSSRYKNEHGTFPVLICFVYLLIGIGIDG